jgi:acyl-CoA reductase-like NAD-dependent aldehyde dehydrogenase
MEVGLCPITIRAACSFTLEDTVLLDEPHRQVIQRHIPLGVTIAISPFNWPLGLSIVPVASSLLAGNTVIVKPSPATPYSVLKAVELGQRFFPPGVLSGLSGTDELGPWLVEHPIPRMVSFTGSTTVGKEIMASCAKSLKRVVLELGGHDPAIVLEDVDLDDVVPKIAQKAFINAGQICFAIKRVYVHEDIYVAFRDRLVEYVRGMKVDEAHEPDVAFGPLQNRAQYDRVAAILREIEHDIETTEDDRNYRSGDIVLGGTSSLKPFLDDAGQPKGFFVAPTILERVNRYYTIMQEETFGKLAS